MWTVQIVLLCKYGNGIIGKHPGIEGAGGKMVVGIIPVHIIHHAHIDIVILIMTMMVLVLMLTWR